MQLVLKLHRFNKNNYWLNFWQIFDKYGTSGFYKHLTVTSVYFVSVIRHWTEDHLHLTGATGNQKITGLA